MPQAGRVGDMAQCSHDEHACGSSGDVLEGEALLGSPDVLINGRAALRVGDPGRQRGCSGADAWHATQGSTGVFINGKPAFRYGDETEHCGGKGELVEGSPDVELGDVRPGAPKERPHDRTVTIDVSDGVGRAVHDVVVSVFCPHTKHEDLHVNGSTSIGKLCSGATVTVHKPLQTGAWDGNATQRSLHTTHHVTSAPKADAGASGGAGPATLVHAPAPAGTARAHHAVHLARPKGTASVLLPTAHNWVELVYAAFGHSMPTGPKELALLGVREASLAPAPGAAKEPVDTLEKEADAGDLADVDFTRERRAPAYNDLLFCVWTDTTAHEKQHVEVFECTIDASPGSELLHLPALLEGKVFHARPGSYDPPRFPGKNIALHVSGASPPASKPPSTTAEKVIAVAHSQLGVTESPPRSNLQKYGAWYGANGVFWCAQFVSWCFAHAGMPEIHFEGCSVAAANFRSGAWGTWHGNTSTAQPGDVVIYTIPGEGEYAHTGIVVRDRGSQIDTIEGNTGSSSGSQSNGGGVFARTRPKVLTAYNGIGVTGFGRPRFPPKHVEPGSVIRWGSEQGHFNAKSARGSTLLHHSYFAKDHGGHEHPSPDAARYRRFMSIYNHAGNKKHIPYLVASSRYLKTYSEWVRWLDAHPGAPPEPRTVVLESGLVSPHGLAHHYLPSFLAKAYADRVLARAHEMHDRHKAAELRAALEACLMKLSF